MTELLEVVTCCVTRTSLLPEVWKKSLPLFSKLTDRTLKIPALKLRVPPDFTVMSR